MKSEIPVILIPDVTETNLCSLVMVCLKRAMKAQIHIISSIKGNKARLSRYCNGFYDLAAKTDEDYISEIKAVAQKCKATCIFPVSEKGIGFIHSHSEVLSNYLLPPLSSIHQIDVARDKWKFACFLSKHNIESPSTILVERKNENDIEMLKDTAFPVLFKPLLSCGGEGIRKFDDYESFLNYWAGWNDREGKAIIQEYIQGYDIDCSALCLNGNITAYTIQRPYHLDKKSYEFSRSIRFLHDPEAFDAAARLMQAIKWNGVCHIDMRYCQKRKKIVIIELNARYWGTLLGSLSAGVNFPHLSLMASQGISFDRPAYRDQGYFTTRQWLRYKMHKYPTRDDVHICLKDTNFKYVLADPLPKLFELIIKLYRHLFSHKPKAKSQL